MTMRKISFSSIVLLVAQLAPAQQSLYIQDLNAREVFPKAPVFRGASSSTGLLALASGDKLVKLLDGVTLAEKLSITGLTNKVGSMSFTESGQSLLTLTSDGQFAVWNNSTGALQKSFSAGSNALTISAQGENLAFVLGSDRTVKVYDALSGKSLGSISSKEDLTAFALHPSGRVFAVAAANGEIRIFTVAQMAMTNTLPEAKERITTLAFSRDSKYLAAGSANGNVFLWDATGLAFKGKMSGQRNGISALTFDPKSRWVVSASFDSTVKFYNAATLSGLNVITEPGAYTTFAHFVTDEVLVAANTKGFVRSWRVLESPPDSLPPTVVLQQPVVGNGPTKVFGTEFEIRGLAYDDSELKEVTIQKTPAILSPLTPAEEAKLPKGSKGKKFAVVLKLGTVGANSFEVLALDKANHTSKQTVTIQRLSSDEALEVSSPANNSETDKISVQVQFKPWFEVSSYSISVNLADLVSNQQPPYGAKAGDVIADEIPLLGGYNQIQLSVTSKQGEKFSKTMGVTRKASMASSTPSSSIPGISGRKETSVGPQRWAVVVGVSAYSNSAITKLQYADRDAQAYADFLRTKEGGQLDSDHLTVLVNETATLAAITDALVNFLGQAIDKDFVTIYFAGHGAPDPTRPQNTYLLTYDTNPSQLGTTAFPMWQIQTVLQRHIAAKKVVVFSDACHSGAISLDFGTRGLGVAEQNQFNQYLVDLAKSKEGTVVFAASAAGEVSQEFADLGHGAFTYYLLEGMKGKADFDNDYTVTINELMSYVEEQVKRRTKNAQNPTRSQTMYDKDLPISWIEH